MQHTAINILLVCKHQKQAVGHFKVVENAMQLCPCLFDPGVIRRVNDEDKTLGACPYSSVH